MLHFGFRQNIGFLERLAQCRIKDFFITAGVSSQPLTDSRASSNLFFSSAIALECASSSNALNIFLTALNSASKCVRHQLQSG